MGPTPTHKYKLWRTLWARHRVFKQNYTTQPTHAMPTTVTTNGPTQQGTQSHKPHGHRDQDATNTKANGQKHDTKNK